MALKTSKNSKSKKMPDHREIYSLLNSVVEKIDKVGTDIYHLDKKVDLHIQKTEFEFKEIRKLDDEQNQLLAQHAQRSEEIKRDNELREAAIRKEYSQRLDDLEAPRKWWNTTTKVILTLGGIATAIITIAKLLHHL